MTYNRPLYNPYYPAYMYDTRDTFDRAMLNRWFNRTYGI